jgi:hypothetical protein
MRKLFPVVVSNNLKLLAILKKAPISLKKSSERMEIFIKPHISK